MHYTISASPSRMEPGYHTAQASSDLPLSPPTHNSTPPTINPPRPSSFSVGITVADAEVLAVYLCGHSTTAFQYTLNWTCYNYIGTGIFALIFYALQRLNRS
jgi:hypothetical protein